MGLFTPIWKKRNANPAKVAAAVRRINNQEKLKNIANHAYYTVACAEALSRINDDQFLFFYATNPRKGDEARQAAADHIVSKELLIEFLCHDFGRSDPSGACVAHKTAKRINDKDVLLNALASRDEAIRWTALEKLNDQNLYEKAACNEESFLAVRAFKQITDDAKKKELLFAMKDDYALMECLQTLITDGWTLDTGTQRRLLDKVSNDNAFGNWSFPFVVGLITDKKLLEDIATTSANYKARRVAALSINNDNVLAAIAMNQHEDISIREIAYDRLQDKSLVDEKTTEYIRSVDPKYWSDEDKRMADIMARDSY